MATLIVPVLVFIALLGGIYAAWVIWLRRRDASLEEIAYSEEFEANTENLEQNIDLNRYYWSAFLETLTRYAIPFIGVSQVNFIRLEETELERKRLIEDTELRMTDCEYETYAREKFGSGIWADRMVKDLSEERKFRLQWRARNIEYLVS